MIVRCQSVLAFVDDKTLEAESVLSTVGDADLSTLKSVYIHLAITSLKDIQCISIGEVYQWHF